MSAREWKRGDLAMIRGLSGPEYLAIYIDDGWAEPRHLRASIALGMPQSIRPLLVIDPEDREQVKRLIKTTWAGWAPRDIDKMQATLREFANPKPPKLDEPTGLGAVVLDDEGETWIRTSVPADDDYSLDKPWYRHGVRKNWLIVDAVRVLSEGYEAGEPA